MNPREQAELDAAEMIQDPKTPGPSREKLRLALGALTREGIDPVTKCRAMTIIKAIHCGWLKPEEEETTMQFIMALKDRQAITRIARDFEVLADKIRNVNILQEGEVIKRSTSPEQLDAYVDHLREFVREHDELRQEALEAEQARTKESDEAASN